MNANWPEESVVPTFTMFGLHDVQVILTVAPGSGVDDVSGGACVWPSTVPVNEPRAFIVSEASLSPERW